MPTTPNLALRYPQGTDSTNLAQYYQNLATDVDNTLAGVWTSYTPVMSSAGTALTEGSKTLWAGKYAKQGKLLTYQFSITLGSGFTNGTGAYYVSVPVAPVAAPSGANGGWIVGSAWLWNGTATYVAMARMNASGKLEFLPNGSTGGALAGSGAPFTWSVNNAISGTVTYQVA